MANADGGRARPPSADARAVRTRARLRDAYISICRSGEVPRVSTLIRTAGVNRSSFYAHFSDLDDMTLWVVDEALGDLSRSQAELAAREGHTTRETAFAAGGAYLEAIEANREPLRAAVTANRASAQARIGSAFERTMLEFLSNTPGWQGSSVRARATATWVAHGWAGAVCAWVVGEAPGTREELLAELVSLNPDPARLP